MEFAVFGELFMEVRVAESKEYNYARYQYVTGVLHRLNISPGVPGFYYLREAILVAYDLGKPVPEIGDLIFGEVVKRHGIEKRKMERALRSVLDNLARTMNRRQALRIITNLDVDCINKPFKNLEFISYMVEALRLQFMGE